MRHIHAMQIFRPFCLLVGLALIAGPSIADQSDPRLEPLFEQLKAASEPEAMSIEQKIWTIWLEPSDSKVESIMQGGTEAMGRGDFRAALDAFDQVVTIAPEFAEGWNKRATIHFFLNNLKQSLADISTALKLEPRHFGALSGRGLVLFKLRELGPALAAFEEALEISPHMSGALSNARALRQMLGHRDA